MIEREAREFHDQFEAVYDDNSGELAAIEKLCDDTGLKTSLDPIPTSIEKQRRIQAHKRVMITAFITSSLFLACYIVYHAQVGSVPFQRHGFARRPVGDR